MSTRRTCVIVLAVAALLLTGCGVRPSAPIDGGKAPTGVAAGTPVYYVNDSAELVVQRRGKRLGNIGQAMKYLLTTRTPQPGLHSMVGTSQVTLALPVTRTTGVITVRLPIDRRAVSGEIGMNQLVCTVLAVHQQSGGPAGTRARFIFTHGPPSKPRHCPVLPSG